MEGTQDHIVSNLHEKETPFAMWKVLTKLFERNNGHRKLALKDKLRSIKMKNNETIMKYPRRFTQCCDEIGGVSINVLEDDLVALSLLGLPKSWHSYQDLVNSRGKLPSWVWLWFDVVRKK